MSLFRRPRGTPAPTVPLEQHELALARNAALTAALKQVLRLCDPNEFRWHAEQQAINSATALLTEGETR